jgi:hypothetical protein
VDPQSLLRTNDDYFLAVRISFEPTSTNLVWPTLNLWLGSVSDENRSDSPTILKIQPVYLENKIMIGVEVEIDRLKNDT